MFLNPTALKRVKPWEIDLTGLLDMLLSIITKSGRVDCQQKRYCGYTLLTSTNSLSLSRQLIGELSHEKGTAREYIVWFLMLQRRRDLF